MGALETAVGSLRKEFARITLLNVMRRSVFVLILSECLASGRWAVVDRIVIVMDRHAITLSDIYNDIRIADFENGDKLDLSLKAQKKAVSRLIDGELIREDMLGGNYSFWDVSAKERLLQQLRQRYANEATYRRALRRYGITQQMLEDHLSSQLNDLQFMSFRFGSGNLSITSPKDLTPTGTDLLKWLAKKRKETRIVFTMKNLK